MFILYARIHTCTSFCNDINTNKLDVKDKPGEIQQNYPEKDTLMHEQNQLNSKRNNRKQIKQYSGR